MAVGTEQIALRKLRLDGGIRLDDCVADDKLLVSRDAVMPDKIVFVSTVLAGIPTPLSFRRNELALTRMLASGRSLACRRAVVAPVESPDLLWVFASKALAPARIISH
jgi:alkylhydroperoxidase family enzyme